MATTQQSKYQYSTSEIELSFANSEERIRHESRISTDAPQLELLHHNERDAANSDDRLRSLRERLPSTALNHELLNAPLLEKQSDLSLGWPTSPRPVKNSFSTTAWKIFIDLLLLLLSLAFLSFALFVIWYNGKPTSRHQDAAERIKQASIWGPTIYPILFASVVGRATFAVLLWRLGKGERIGILDTLASSSSLTSTVVSQLQLRAISYVGVGLIAIWTLSPVGGQASFRQISYGPKDFPENAEFLYVVPSPWLWLPDYEFFKPTLDSSYLAALMSQTTAQGSPRDTWGHVKVPRIEHYESTSPSGDGGWYSTEDSTPESYSSFIGVPISGMNSPEFIDYSTKIQAKYFHLQCDRYLDDSDDWDAQFTFNTTRWLGYVYWNENVTSRAEIPPDEVEPFAFVIVSNSPLGLIWNCTIQTTYVEVEIACSTHDACAVVRIRRSHLAHPPPAYTQLSPLVGFQNTPWESALVNMAIEDGSTDAFYGYDDDAGSSFLSMYHMSQDYYVNRTNIAYLEDIDVDNKTIVPRLSQVVNAYWATMNGKASLRGNFDASTRRSNANVSWYDQDQDDFHSMDSFDQGNAETLAKAWPSTGTRRSNVEVFKAHFGWVIALIVSSTVLIVASLVPFYLRTFLPHGPDVLMNFSSLAARDNPYVTLPGTGTYLDAADRSRLLKDVRIQFGDVEEGGEIGRLAIGRLDGDVAPLRKGRKYA